jgi:hypothetical protein
MGMTAKRQKAVFAPTLFKKKITFYPNVLCSFMQQSCSSSVRFFAAKKGAAMSWDMAAPILSYSSTEPNG